MGDPLETTPVVIMRQSASALGQMQKAEYETQVELAKRYPRDLGRVMQTAIAGATYNPEIAGQQGYAVRRGGSLIRGKSIRLAEVMASAWGNIRYGSRVLNVGESFLTAQGFCVDLETNSAASVEVERRITNKDSVRYSDDMIQTTANAACAIALRNAIFRVIPAVYADQVYAKAQDAALGKGLPIETLRQKALEACARYGVSKERMVAAVGKGTLEELEKAQLVEISELINGIREGHQSVEDAFPNTGKAASAAPGPKTDPLQAPEASEAPEPAPKPKQTRTPRQEQAKPEAPAHTDPPPPANGKYPTRAPDKAGDVFRDLYGKMPQDHRDAYDRGFDESKQTGDVDSDAHDRGWYEMRLAAGQA